MFSFFLLFSAISVSSEVVPDFDCAVSSALKDCIFEDHINTNADFLSRITRYIGCIFAYAVFIWRWLNVPENWSYVNSPWSWWIMGLTLLPETIFPFVYLRVLKEQEARELQGDGKKRL